MKKTALVFALLGAMLPAWALAAACGTVAELVSGFEGPSTTCTSADLAGWVSSQASIVVYNTGSPSAPASNVEGDTFAKVTWSAVSNVLLDLPSGSYTSGTSSDFSTASYLRVAFAPLSGTLVANFSPRFVMTTATASTITYAAPVGTIITKTSFPTAASWDQLLVSLNYVRNLGVNLGNVSNTRIHFNKSTPGNGLIFLDSLTLDTSLDSAQPAVSGAAITATATGCGTNLLVSFPTPVPTGGKDSIYGYHVYRSTAGSGGPFTSFKYITGVASSPVQFNDSSILSNTHAYKVLPFSISTTALAGGATGTFTIDSAIDGGLGPLAGLIPGVNEVAIGSATSSPNFDPYGGCTPTPTYTLTPYYSPTPTVTPTPSFTYSPTFTTPSLTPSQTIYVTATPTFTISPTFSMTPTVTETFTVSPIVTQTLDPNQNAQIYPNPFNPDRGEVFRLGNVPAGETMTIYNLIGEFVYSAKIRGNPALDAWDGMNANGIRVVTGIYFITISGSSKIYRMAVLRN